MLLTRPPNAGRPSALCAAGARARPRRRSPTGLVSRQRRARRSAGRRESGPGPGRRSPPGSRRPGRPRGPAGRRGRRQRGRAPRDPGRRGDREHPAHRFDRRIRTEHVHRRPRHAAEVGGQIATGAPLLRRLLLLDPLSAHLTCPHAGVARPTTTVSANRPGARPVTRRQSPVRAPRKATTAAMSDSDTPRTERSHQGSNVERIRLKCTGASENVCCSSGLSCEVS